MRREHASSVVAPALDFQQVGSVTARPPLVLTGAPAVGKSVTGHALALQRPRCAFIDVDDVRQLVVAGGAAPWDGEQGLVQQRLGAVNACALARNFLERDIEVVIADVLTPATAHIYSQQLPGCRIVHLTASWPEGRHPPGVVDRRRVPDAARGRCRFAAARAPPPTRR